MCLAMLFLCEKDKTSSKSCQPEINKMSVIPMNDVWTIARSLKKGDTLSIRFRGKGLTRVTEWKSAVVIEAASGSGTTAEEYAVIRQAGRTKKGNHHQEVMFPQDGKNGTTDVEYLAVAVDEKEIVLTPAKKKEERKKPESSSSSSSSSPDSDSDSEDPSDGEVGHDAYDHSTHEYHKQEFYQEPAKWTLFLKAGLDLEKAKAWFEKKYAETFSHPAERELHQGVVRAIQLGLTTAYEVPSITLCKPWQEEQRTLIERMIVQKERFDGAADHELTALNAAFHNKSSADYVKQAYKRAAERLKVLRSNPETKHLQGFHKGHGKGKGKGKKGGPKQEEGKN